MKAQFILVILLFLALFTFPISYQAQETDYTAVYTPFDARYIDVDDNEILYAIDYNGTVWSLATTVSGAQWQRELVTSNTTNTGYVSLWISPYYNYNVFVAINYEGIWKRNSSGWHQIYNFGSPLKIPELPWHWAENSITGEIYLQSHARYIYNSSDGENWGMFYNMTASDSGYYAGPIDDHFHAIAWDNETRALWATGGDTRDILRRYNSSGLWEIVGIDQGNLGGLGNLYQPTAICFDDTYAYFGADASTYCFRLNKSITSAELPVNSTDSKIEVILTLGGVYPGSQWVFEARYINETLYMPTCYNDGIMLASSNGVEWINVFEADGYYLPGYGSPSSPQATTRGGISSMTYRTPIYFLHNTNVYRLNLNTDDFRHLYNEPFVTDYNNGTMTVQRGVTSGTGYIGIGKSRVFTEINATAIGASMYEIIDNRTFEPGENGGWSEDGYGTISLTNAEAHTGAWSLMDVVGNGTSGASVVYPPYARYWQIPTYGEGTYFWSVWLKTNVSWTHPANQPNFFLTIGTNTTGVGNTPYPIRINITTSWQQHFWAVYIEDTVDYLQPRIDIYRENATPREVYIDDAMFWGSLKFSYVDSTRQRYVGAAYTNDWNVNETLRETENITLNLAGIETTYMNILSNGTELELGGIHSSDVEVQNILPYTVTILNSSQCLFYMVVSYAPIVPYLPVMFLLGMVGLCSMVLGGIYSVGKIKKGEWYDGARAGVIYIAIGFGLFIAWVWLGA